MERVIKVEKHWCLRMNLEVDLHTEEEVESMLKKLRAVLNGAEVIEMPTDEEIDTESKKYEYPPLFKAAINFLKSKIVK